MRTEGFVSTDPSFVTDYLTAQTAMMKVTKLVNGKVSLNVNMRIYGRMQMQPRIVLCEQASQQLNMYCRAVRATALRLLIYLHDRVQRFKDQRCFLRLFSCSIVDAHFGAGINSCAIMTSRRQLLKYCKLD